MIRHRFSRAFTLTEVLLTLSLMGVAGLVSTQLFRASIKSFDSAHRADNMVATITNITTLLRHDAWSASNIESPDPQTVVITCKGRPAVRWHVADGKIERKVGDTPPADDCHWLISGNLELKQDGASITFVARDARWRFMAPMLVSGRTS